MYRIAPSIRSADFERLGDEVRSVIAAGADWIHPDASARRLIERTGRDIRLEVDGGIEVDNTRRVADAGADTFVAGSAIFGQPDDRSVIDALRAELAQPPFRMAA